MPGGRLVLKEACPLASSVRLLKGPGPKVGSSRFTVPVGVLPAPVTAIVKVTCCPALAGLGVEVIDVALGVVPVTF